MRCKKGDIAIVTSSAHGVNLGKIVTCLEFVGNLPQGVLPFPAFLAQDGDYWRVDTYMVCVKVTTGEYIGKYCYARDSQLTPLPSETLETEEKETIKCLK